WLEEHRRQSHVIKIGDRWPDTLATHHRLIEGRVRPNKSEHGLRSSTTRHSTSTQIQRHEPSGKTLAAFACVTPASLLTLQPPDNFAIDAMDHAGGVCGLGVGVAVADDGVAIGEWVGIG